MNIKIDVLENEESPSYGAAILASVGCGEYASVQEASEKMASIIDTVEPDAEISAKYENKYNIFKKIYPLLRDIY